jgi:uncharacterized protein (DUF1330 family)
LTATEPSLIPPPGCPTDRGHLRRFLAAGQNVTALEGEPPKTRVTIQVWESLEKMQAAYNSAEYKEARKIGDKYAKFRAFAVEGLPQ